jgi:hypothetical protein
LKPSIIVKKQKHGVVKNIGLVTMLIGTQADIYDAWANIKDELLIWHTHGRLEMGTYL